MPAPLDVSACGGWEAIRTLAVAIGARAAARRLGLPEDAVRQKCTREGWLAECRLPVATPLPLSIRPTPPVAAVATAAEALQAALTDDSRASRLAGSRATRAALEYAAQLEGEEAHAKGQDTLTSLKGAALVHSWEDKSSATVRVNVYAGTGPVQIDGETIDV